MGILQNGMPYLTQAGLAQLCGVQRRNISDIAHKPSIEERLVSIELDVEKIKKLIETKK
ncbi:MULTISPECIES: hypothetical protein [unclassified Photorhabdus]|uniref:hypothetical protein n=1 Tax=unclassified Photorhabdus TaxID=2620880 RepID=UPI0013148F28|nr:MULTISPECIES: hypothetical protein [unclassified Photorhabdus]